jgi:DNA-binding NarL/FixJ family response regulator
MNPSPENNPKNRQSTALPMDTASVSKNDNKQADDEEILRLQNPQFQWRNAHWVILVDDEESIRESVGDFLYDAGYQVTACDDAPTAWKLLISYNSVNNNEEKNPQKQQLQRIPDCIISDIRMPEMNGIEFLGQIRQNDILKNVPVILLTAKGMTSDRIQGYKAGADVYLSKPFVPEELLSIVDNAILRKSQMMGPNGPLVELSQEMALVKQLVNQQRYETVVERTDVYLTPAQREILDLLCRGYTNQEIADARNTSKHYVTKTLQKIYSLTETKTRTQLLQWAIRNGYVPSRL